MRPRLSLTTRLTALYTLVLGSVLLGMVAITSVAVNRHFEELDRDTLRDKIHLVEDIVTKAQSLPNLQDRLDDALQNHAGLYVRITDTAGAVLYASASFRFPQTTIHPRPERAQDTATSWKQGGREYRLLSRQVSRGAALGSEVRIWAAIDTAHHAHFIGSLQAALWIYAAAAALLSGILSWWAARTGLAPLRAMKARAQAVTANQLDQRMPAEAVPVEMADLAISLNDMLTRLEQDFQRLSDFSSDLAHELRTPLSNLLTQTQVALAQPRDGSTYRDILASNAEEFQQLARMVSDMLLLAKAEHGLLLRYPEDIALADEVRALFDFYEAVAEEKGVNLQLHGEGALKGDRLMLRRAISNLLSNALRYTPPRGKVTVEITHSPGGVAICVENPGAEISPDMLPRLFDRFFRVDKSRANYDTESTGLGLAITKAIVQAHGGTVSVTSSGGKNRFTIELSKDSAS